MPRSVLFTTSKLVSNICTCYANNVLENKCSSDVILGVKPARMVAKCWLGYYSVFHSAHVTWGKSCAALSVAGDCIARTVTGGF